MKKSFLLFGGLAILTAYSASYAECVISEATKQLDPVEVGYCESDAVFIGKVEQKIDTMRAFTEAGSEQTKHIGIQTSTVKIVGRIKGETADKVTMLSELYNKDRAFEFEILKTYLIFAKKLPGENEYAGASAKCSVQPTLVIEAAANAIKQLEDHAKGRKKIDCTAIRPKQKN